MEPHDRAPRQLIAINFRYVDHQSQLILLFEDQHGAIFRLLRRTDKSAGMHIPFGDHAIEKELLP